MAIRTGDGTRYPAGETRLKGSSSRGEGAPLHHVGRVRATLAGATARTSSAATVILDDRRGYEAAGDRSFGDIRVTVGLRRGT